MNTEIFTAETSQQADWVAAVSSHVVEVDQRFRNFIQKKPVLSVLCAVGAGLAVSLLLNKLSVAAQESRDDNGNAELLQ